MSLKIAQDIFNIEPITFTVINLNWDSGEEPWIDVSIVVNELSDLTLRTS